MTDIKQYLKETNTVLLTEQAYKYLKEKASVIEKLEEIKAEMDIIAELEQIKAEMEQERDLVDLSCADSFNWNIRLIDKHITELKGE